MTNEQFMRLAINLHTRTIVGLVDAVERADTPAQRAERLAMIRDAVLEFKKDFGDSLTKEVATQRDDHVVEPGTWYIARWPDGTWCNWDERHEFTHMSDDYECRMVCTTDNNHEPDNTTSCSPPTKETIMRR